MEQRGRLVYCEVTLMSLFRPDPEGRGIWIKCRGHKQEELQTWEKMGLTKEIAEQWLNELLRTTCLE